MKRFLSGLVVCLAMVAHPAFAASITFGFDAHFTGDDMGGPGPWLQGTLDDSPGNGDLLLTLDGTGLSDNEFVTQVFFNFSPNKDVTDLSVVLQSETTSGSFVGYSTGTNAFQADGDGKFDLLLDFNSDPPRFGDGDIVTFLLSRSILPLFVTDFLFQSDPSGGNHGPYYAAAHVQGGLMTGSSWIAIEGNPCPGCTPTPTDVDPVPEPSSWLLLSSGILGMVLAARRRKR